MAPTGAGKTLIGASVIRRARDAGERILFVIHRRELVKQTADRLREMFGRLEVGIVAAGQDADPFAPIQVGMVQTLLARGTKPDATLIILDESHHYASSEWIKLAAHYSSARCLGLTATPERRDGKPLGDIFQKLIVAASYSELLRDGNLVPCRVFQPPEVLDRALAQDPLEAWKRYADNSKTFAFCATVQAAYELRDRFNAEGIPAATIEAETPKRERDEILRKFIAGEILVLTNVYTLTEGVDVPSARCILLARGADHVGIYLQIVGRVLRPHPSKQDAILIDLTGATLKHGLPTEDRTYALDGEGIQRASVQPLRNCLFCGATIPSVQRICPECGNEHIPAEVKPPKIYSLELREVYAGADTPVDAQMRELQRLVGVAEGKDLSLYWVVKEFKNLFKREPTDELQRLPLEKKKEWFERMKNSGLKRGKTINQVRGLYRAVFGRWPEWQWR